MFLVPDPQLSDDGNCFACGKNNPHSLGMQVRYESEQALCRLSLDKRFQGWAGMAHGGITATMLDEIMAHAVIHNLGQGITINFSMRYRAAVPLEQELEVRGWIKERRSRKAVAQSQVVLAASGQVLAEATADFLLRAQA